MNQEIIEILKYLEPREDYLVWAGFAQFAHLGLKASADIDIYVSSKENMNRISADFQQNGWKIKKHIPVERGSKVVIIGMGMTLGEIIGWKWDKLEKNETTFDIVFSKPASELFFHDKVKIEVYSHKINFISKEFLFITKLGQLSSSERTDEKRKRDLETIMKLRKQIDLDKIRKMVLKLPDSYWLTGLV